jgi:hypothetical protein
MSFQTLYRAKSFGPGADLWVMPEAAHSSMAKKVDWYLNFQISKAELHTPMPISPELKKVIVENDLGLPEHRLSPDAPLMISSDQHFPVSKIVEIKTLSSLQEWVASIQTLWLKLKRPRLRVFLPNELTPEEFQKLWRGDSKAQLLPHEELTLVPR